MSMEYLPPIWDAVSKFAIAREMKLERNMTSRTVPLRFHRQEASMVHQ